VKCNSGSVVIQNVMVENQGIVVKIHSNYYYVEFDEKNWECMLRNKLKKEGIEPKVGDRVLIDQLNPENNTAVIISIAERKNELVKPNIANLDQVIIVASGREPDFNSLLLDKFIILVESENMQPVICINKSDLIDERSKAKIEEIYGNLSYPLIFVS